MFERIFDEWIVVYRASFHIILLYLFVFKRWFLLCVNID